MFSNPRFISQQVLEMANKDSSSNSQEKKVAPSIHVVSPTSPALPNSPPPQSPPPAPPTSQQQKPEPAPTSTLVESVPSAAQKSVKFVGAEHKTPISAASRHSLAVPGSNRTSLHQPPHSPGIGPSTGSTDLKRRRSLVKLERSRSVHGIRQQIAAGAEPSKLPKPNRLMATDGRCQRVWEIAARILTCWYGRLRFNSLKLTM